MKKCISGIDLLLAALSSAVSDDAVRLVEADLPSLDVLLGAVPFRSVICRAWPAVERCAWPVIGDDLGALPDALLAEIVITFWRGHGVLLLSASRAPRDRAKRFLRALLVKAPL